MKRKRENSYTIEELLEWFIRYRRYITADSIDPIGDVDFESEFWHFLTYIKGNQIE
jgi:hypothetical protein